MLRNARRALGVIQMYQLQLQKLGILRNVWELTGKCICFLFTIPFLLGSIKPAKGKSPAESRAVFMSPLGPLEGFLGFFLVLGCCRADLHR